MKTLDQAVVLCGGRGTRLALLLGDRPKALVPVAGRPLIERLLDDLAAAGTRDVLLLAGFGGDQVAAAVERAAPASLRVRTVVEATPLGTAGALRGVREHLAERFLLVLGDVYTALDWRRFAGAADSHGGLATLLVHRSSHPEDSDVLAVADDDRVTAWVGRRPEERRRAVVASAALGNAGVAALHRDVVGLIPEGRPCDLFGELLPRLVDRRAPVYGYVTSEYVRDLGTPDRLAAVEADVRGGRTARRADAVLLDRDGTLNEEVGLVTRPDQLRLLEGAGAALRRLNEAGIATALVTNQPAAARGLCSPADLDAVQTRLAELLAAEGARIDAVFACRHHPETRHGEGDPTLRGPCRCRKPSTGLVDDALASLGRPPWRTVVVGDRSLDLQLARNAGLPGIGLATGAGCRDGACPARATWRFPDLAAAVDWIVAAPAPARGAIAGPSVTDGEAGPRRRRSGMERP